MLRVLDNGFSLFRVFCVILVALVVVGIIIADMDFDGVLVVRPDLKTRTAITSELLPHERIAITDNQIEFVGDPVYLDLRLPRRYMSVQIDLDAAVTGPYSCSIGVRSGDANVPSYTLIPYSAPILPSTWSSVSSGDMVLYQRTPTYTSVDEFSRRHPRDFSVGTLGIVPAIPQGAWWGVIRPTPDERVLYTTAPIIKITAYNSAGLGEVRIGSRAIHLDEIQKPYWVSVSSARAEIRLPSGDIEVAGPGLFALDKEILEGYRGPITLEGRDALPASVAYVLAPAVRDTLTIALAPEHYTGTELRFVFSQPYIEVEPSCAITSMTLEFRRPPVSLHDIYTFFREYARDTYYAITTRN